MSADLIERLKAKDAKWQAMIAEWREAAPSVWTDELVQQLSTTIEAEAANALAAKEAALSEMRAALERVRKSLKPFAKRAKDAMGPGYMTTVKDEWLTAAARTLASQDEGEER